MLSVEHIFIAIASPIFVFCFLSEKEDKRHLISLLTGFTVAFLSGYVNSYFAFLFNMTEKEAVMNITPIIEELLKMFPVLFYAEGYAKGKRQIINLAVGIGLGFAILENCSYLVTVGAESLALAAVRGLATGVLHPLCSLIVSFGIVSIYAKVKFSVVSFIGFLCTAIMVHGTFNLLLIADDKMYNYLGCLIPLLLTMICIILYKINKKKINEKL